MQSLPNSHDPRTACDTEKTTTFASVDVLDGALFHVDVRLVLERLLRVRDDDGVGALEAEDLVHLLEGLAARLLCGKKTTSATRKRGGSEGKDELRTNLTQMTQTTSQEKKKKNVPEPATPMLASM